MTSHDLPSPLRFASEGGGIALILTLTAAEDGRRLNAHFSARRIVATEQKNSLSDRLELRREITLENPLNPEKVPNEVIDWWSRELAGKVFVQFRPDPDDEEVTGKTLAEAIAHMGTQLSGRHETADKL